LPFKPFLAYSDTQESPRPSSLKDKVKRLDKELRLKLFFGSTASDEEEDFKILTTGVNN